MSKVTINESKLREMIAESVREVLKENGMDETFRGVMNGIGNAAAGAFNGRGISGGYQYGKAQGDNNAAAARNARAVGNDIKSAHYAANGNQKRADRLANRAQRQHGASDAAYQQSQAASAKGQEIYGRRAQRGAYQPHTAYGNAPYGQQSPQFNTQGNPYNTNNYAQQDPQKVKALQQKLNQQYGANLAVDGKLGPKTRAAMQQYGVNLI